MSAFPDGPLPSDYKTTIADLIREVGPASMTPSILTRRLESKYKINFAPHGDAVNGYVKEFMMSDEMRRELAMIQKSQEEGAGGKGKKRGRPAESKGKKDRKEKKDKKEKKEKKEKKPDDYPKAALSAYFFFAAEFRDSHKDLAVKMQMTKAGEAWRGMSADEKQPYEVKAAADKARYDKDMAAYLAKGGAVVKRAGASSKAKKDPNAPKRPISAYFFFAADFRNTHKNLPVNEQMAKAGEAWRGMSADEKKPYEVKAAADRERYARQCAAAGIKTKAPKTGGNGKDAVSSSSDDSSSDSSSDGTSSESGDES